MRCVSAPTESKPERHLVVDLVETGASRLSNARHRYDRRAKKIPEAFGIEVLVLHNQREGRTAIESSIWPAAIFFTGSS